MLLSVVRLLRLLKKSGKLLGPQQKTKEKASWSHHRLFIVLLWIITHLIVPLWFIWLLRLFLRRLSQGSKTRSISFDPFLFPLTPTLKDFIPRDHLMSTGLTGVENNTSLHNLSCTFTRVSCLYFYFCFSFLFLIVIFSLFDHSISGCLWGKDWRHDCRRS